MRFGLLLQYITPHRRVLLVVLGLLLAGSAVSLANPWLAGLLTASVLGQGELDPALLLGLWLALLAIGSLISFFTSYRIGSTGQQLTCELRNRLYQHMQLLPVGYYQQRRRGDTLTLLSTDAAIISSFVTDTLVQLLPALLTFTGAFLLMAWLDVTIALLSILFLPAYVVTMKLLGRRLLSVVEENLGMLPAIKAFTREQHEQLRFEAANSELLGLSRQQLRVQATLSPAIGFLGGLGLVALLWVGTSHIESGQLEAPQLVSLLLYAMLLVSPLRTLANVYGRIQRTRGSAERIIEFLGEQPEPTDEGKRLLEVGKGHIRFENVRFAYPGRPEIFRGLSLEIKAGETVALTGPNGAGKTTLAHLLMRFADPDGGLILIDGNDTRDCTLASVRAQAARSAHAHEFISQLPDGYDTVIGDQGVRLSGGQRQRISLARTLLKNPPILVLDEATAMFDPDGEKAFVDECHDMLQQKTVILITHRPTSLALADRVIEMPYLPPSTSDLNSPETG
jgi:ABC-type multidrug transport system fused ATPase/permease subunit